MNHHPRILVAGCGYTGRRCADFFCAAGFNVLGLVSSADSARALQGKPYEVYAADAADPEQVRALGSRIGHPDIVIHCMSGHGGRHAAAYKVTYILTLRHLLGILQPAFCVFTSSTSVYTQNDGSEVNEESPAGGTPTADVLLEAERLSLARGGSVIRLGGIYGPGRCRFIQAALADQPPPPESKASFINLIHRDDAASALVHAALHRLCGIFNAVDDHPGRRSAIAEAIRRPVPAAPANDNAIPATGKRVSNAKLRATGWHPRFPSVADALREDPELRRSCGCTTTSTGPCATRRGFGIASNKNL